MIVYNYTPEGILIGPEEAHADPLEPGNYLIPALSTTEKPPKEKEGKYLVFVNEKWTHVDIPKKVTDEAPEEVDETALKIAQLIQELKGSDYKFLPDYDKEPSQELIDRRAELRSQIRELKG